MPANTACLTKLPVKGTRLRLSWLVAILVFICAPCATNTGFAAENADVHQYQQKLDRLQHSITKIKEHLKGTRHKRGSTITELSKLETGISDNSRKLLSLKTEINDLGSRIMTLRKALDALTSQLLAQRSALADQLRAAYAQGRQQHIKMLLNQQNPAQLGRIQVYFDYLNRSREQQIHQYLQSIDKQNQLSAALAESLDNRTGALAQQQRQTRQLHLQRVQRTQLLAKLEQEILNQEQTLTELESSRSRIENLLMSLGELLADIPPNPNDKQAFSQQKGRLPWPVKGPFLARFGVDKPFGELKWKGVLIGSVHGTPVHAVSHGRVAFSDWLQGFGFIAIIDHGEGYMSLYGHNETLLKQAGDWVSAGEVIATSGDSGGQPQPGLYFEIRSRGKPVNPNVWCSSKAGFTTAG